MIIVTSKININMDEYYSLNIYVGSSNKKYKIRNMR